MKYKNSSNTTVRLNENTFIQPGAVVELSDDDLKNPEVVKMKDWNWLIPIAETVISDVLVPKVVKASKQKTKQTGEVEDSDIKNQAINEAIKRASLTKPDTKTWNPMDDAAPEGEPDFIGVPRSIDTSKQYGSGEIEYDAKTHPVTHMGGGESDDPGDNPTGKAAYIPHHPEDLTKFYAPIPDPVAERPTDPPKPSPVKKKGPKLT